MRKIKDDITILAVGDNSDYDSYRKFDKERRFVSERGFDYVNVNYMQLLAKAVPPIRTKKVIIFAFFPFQYWNRYIEHKSYKGIYGNRTFHAKFNRFWDKIRKTINGCLPDKEVFFINPPRLCGLYRDKLNAVKKFSRAGIRQPKLYGALRIKDIESLLAKGHSFFLKPRYGSMGKGITVLNWSNWQTNFRFKDGKIISHLSDHGWKFMDITGNRRFLSRLIKKDILIEKEIDALVLKRMKVDMRIYTFLNKIIYVYPRKNRIEKLTTNISQGAKGDPEILGELPGHLIKKAKKIVSKIPKILGLGFAGIDIMIDRNLRDIYVLDVNVFPGFPKRKTFNIARSMISELVKARARGGLAFEKGRSI
jgi:hypothetical protein